MRSGVVGAGLLAFDGGSFCGEIGSRLTATVKRETRRRMGVMGEKS